MAIDIQKVSQASLMKATDAQVKKISAKCTELQNKEQEVSNIEERLKKAKKEFLTIVKRKRFNGCELIISQT